MTGPWWPAQVAQPEAGVLGAHALDSQLAQLDRIALHHVKVGRLAQAVHRLPPPAGVGAWIWARASLTRARYRFVRAWSRSVR